MGYTGAVSYTHLDVYKRQVNKLINEYHERRPLVEWCFRWLYSMPEVTVVLSGTKTLEQLKQNMEIFLSLIHI